VTVQKCFTKPCKFCGSMLVWNDIQRQFDDLPEFNEGRSQRHQCANSSTKHRQEELDQKFNQTVNDLKTEINNKFSDQVQRIDSLQKSTARNTSLLVEIKSKLDGALRGYS